jgi:hypothetical protein
MASRRISGVTLLLSLGLIGCGNSGGSAETPASKAFEPPVVPRQIAEDVKFPAAGKQNVKVVEGHLLDLPFLTGGNLATYDDGKRKYSLFTIRMKSAAQAGAYVSDIEKQLRNAKFVASYGGYWGTSENGPLFVFAKGSYLAGVAGLSEAEAVEIGKQFAARL